MLSFESITTFSGLFAFAATLVLLRGRFILGSTLLIIAGSAGLGIFWDRWSSDAGHRVQVQALLTGAPPSGDEFALLATHLPMLALGIAILALHQRMDGRGVPQR